MPPLALTDEQLDTVFRSAAPLVQADRDLFLREVCRPDNLAGNRRRRRRACLCRGAEAFLAAAEAGDLG